MANILIQDGKVEAIEANLSAPEPNLIVVSPYDRAVLGDIERAIQAADLGLSPYALVMAVAIAASSSFMSPVAHPANVLIMGPGGYRFVDYIKVGLPLTLVCLLVTLLLLPLVWPLVP